MRKFFVFSSIAFIAIILSGCSLFPATPAIPQTPTTNTSETPQNISPESPAVVPPTQPAPAATSPAAPVASQTAKPTATQNVQVAIRNFAFDQPIINIPIGSTVTWTNLDAVGHTATADNLSFDSPLLEQGQSYSFTFNAVGSYGYYCRPHPQMRGTIIVK